MLKLEELSRLILNQVDYNRKCGEKDEITVKHIYELIETNFDLLRKIKRDDVGSEVRDNGGSEVSDKGECYSNADVDFVYMCGVFNVKGIEGLRGELDRLSKIGREPSDMVDGYRGKVS